MLLIVIVSWNARADLERCLRSLTAAPPARPHTIAVVDNASEDGSAEMVARMFPSIRLIRSGENLGFARANNLAIRGLEGDPILLLNPDTVVPPGAIDELVDYLERHPDAAAVGPRLVDGNRRVEISFGRVPSPLREAVRKVVSALHARRVRVISRWLERRASRPRSVDWVSGAALLLRRAPAEAVGLLDEEYGLYWEDIDLCARLRRRGWRILFTPSAEITHLRGRSAAAAAPAAIRKAYRAAQLTFYERHRPRWVPALRLYQRLRYH
ncbi:MAG TPA: glycosyltransferase family 2 protein [Vicinamibacterales bacterium]|nr:glycosyltransferase family 2 protein [Vicinamibacterales bacterium]